MSAIWFFCFSAGVLPPDEYSKRIAPVSPVLAAAPVIANTQRGRGLEDLPGLGFARIVDPGGDHRGAQPRFPQGLFKSRQFLFHFRRVDMPVVPHGEIGALKADVGERFGQLSGVGNPFQVLGEQTQARPAGGGFRRSSRRA